MIRTERPGRLYSRGIRETMVSLEQFSWPLRLVLFGEERYTMSTDTLRINRLTQMVRFLSTSRLFLWMLWVMYRERRRAIRAHAQSSSAAQSASEALIQVLVAFRTTAIKQGVLLIKLGQFLSTRIDVLPEQAIAVLSSLQDEVPCASWLFVQRRYWPIVS